MKRDTLANVGNKIGYYKKRIKNARRESCEKYQLNKCWRVSRRTSDCKQGGWREKEVSRLKISRHGGGKPGTMATLLYLGV